MSDLSLVGWSPGQTSSHRRWQEQSWHGRGRDLHIIQFSFLLSHFFVMTLPLEGPLSSPWWSSFGSFLSGPLRRAELLFFQLVEVLEGRISAGRLTEPYFIKP